MLDKINKKVFYKPYPEFNKRYYDKNPCLLELRNKKNIKVIKNNYDARYLINNSRVLVCGTATSTVAWTIMSDIPTVFINYKHIAPLKKNAYDSFIKGLFLFDYNNKNFFADITSFLNKDFDEIKEIWQSKEAQRKRLREDYISSSQQYDLNKIFK